MAPVALGLSDFEAKVVTAQLGADGILWELRGVVDSMYPLGGIDVLVPLDELAAAEASLRGDEVPARSAAPVPDSVQADAHGDDLPRRSRSSRRWWATAALIAGLAAFSLTRMASAITMLNEDRRDECRRSALAAVEGFTLACH
jgi:hypothetical protein